MYPILMESALAISRGDDLLEEGREIIVFIPIELKICLHTGNIGIALPSISAYPFSDRCGY